MLKLRGSSSMMALRLDRHSLMMAVWLRPGALLLALVLATTAFGADLDRRALLLSVKPSHGTNTTGNATANASAATGVCDVSSDGKAALKFILAYCNYTGGLSVAMQTQGASISDADYKVCYSVGFARATAAEVVAMKGTACKLDASDTATVGALASSVVAAASSCAKAPCKNNASCADSADMATHACVCAAGWSGPACAKDADDCAAAPCKNGGTCTDGGTSNYTCACPSLWAGKLCTVSTACRDHLWVRNIDNTACNKCPSGFASDATFSRCVDVNDCAAAPCKNGANCTDAGANKFACACAAGWAGATCAADADDCAAAPCKNGGTCMDVGTTNFSCACPGLWAGKLCTVAVPTAERYELQGQSTVAAGGKAVLAIARLRHSQSAAAKAFVAVLLTDGASTSLSVALVGGKLSVSSTALTNASATYRVAVTVAGTSSHVQGSPWNVVVTASTPDATKSSVSFASMAKTVAAGAAQSFKVVCYDRFGNLVTNSSLVATKVLGPSVICPTVSPGAAGTYTVGFTPSLIGSYTVLVAVTGNVITGGSRDFVVVAGPPSAKLSVAKLEKKLSAVLIAGQTLPVHVTFKDAYGNIAKAAASDTVLRLDARTGDTSSTTSQTAVTGATSHKLSAQLNVSGQYVVSVTLNGAALVGSPIAAWVSPATAFAPQCVASGGALKAAIKGGAVSFALQTFDRFGNALSAGGSAINLTITGKAGSTGSGKMNKVVDTKNGKYSVTYTVNGSGSFLVAVLVGGQPAKNSPFTVTILATAGEPAARQTTAALQQDATADSLGTIYIQVRNSFGLSVPGKAWKFKVAFTGPQTVNTFGVVYYSGGVYVAKFSATKAGLYNATVSLGLGTPVSYSPLGDSPLQVRIRSGVADASKCKISAPASLAKATVDETLVFALQAFDKYGNPTDRQQDKFTLALKNANYSFTGSVQIKQGVNASCSSGCNIYSASVTPTFPGTFSIQMAVNGEVVTDKMSPASVYIRPAEAPRMVTAQFSDSGGFITAMFHISTHRHEQSGEFSCQDVFNTSSAALGSTARCLWKSSSALVAYMSNAATIQPGGLLTLRDASLLNARKNSYFAAGSVAVSGPAQMVVPRIIFNAPTVLGSCDTYRFDASASTGSGGRPLQFSYSLHQAAHLNASQLSALAATAKGWSSTAFALSTASSAAGGSFKFVATARNFLGGEANATFSFTRSQLALPQASIIGTGNLDASGNVQLVTKSTEDVWLQSKFSVASCAIGTQMTFSWSQVSGPAGYKMDARTQKSPVLFVPAKSLTVGQAYVFRVIGMMQDKALNNSITVGIASVLSPITVAIAGGDMRIPKGSDLVLQAAITDPDKSSAAVAYSWSCALLGSPSTGCPNLGKASVGFASSAKTTIASSTLRESTSYVFTVTATMGSRVGTSTATVRTLAFAAPLVKLSPVGLINRGQKLQLVGSASASAGSQLAYNWTVSECDLNIAAAAVSGVASLTLTFRPNSMLAGQRCKFALSVKETGVANAGVATTVVETNSPPSSGTLSFAASTQTGPLAANRVVLKAADWADIPQHNPLSYAFGEITGSVETPLSARSAFNKLDALLVAPGNHTIYVDVYDAIGAVSRAQTTVLISKAASLSDADFSAQLSKSLGSYDLDNLFMLSKVGSSRRRLRATSSAARFQTLFNATITFSAATAAKPLDVTRFAQLFQELVMHPSLTGVQLLELLAAATSNAVQGSTHGLTGAQIGAMHAFAAGAIKASSFRTCVPSTAKALSESVQKSGQKFLRSLADGQLKQSATSDAAQTFSGLVAAGVASSSSGAAASGFCVLSTSAQKFSALAPLSLAVGAATAAITSSTVKLINPTGAAMEAQLVRYITNPVPCQLSSNLFSVVVQLSVLRKGKALGLPARGASISLQLTKALPADHLASCITQAGAAAFAAGQCTTTRVVGSQVTCACGGTFDKVAVSSVASTCGQIKSCGSCAAAKGAGGHRCGWCPTNSDAFVNVNAAKPSTVACRWKSKADTQSSHYASKTVQKGNQSACQVMCLSGCLGYEYHPVSGYCELWNRQPGVVVAVDAKATPSLAGAVCLKRGDAGACIEGSATSNFMGKTCPAWAQLFCRCPGNCGGSNGVCSADFRVGVCKCRAGFLGADCAARNASAPQPPRPAPAPRPALGPSPGGTWVKPPSPPPAPTAPPPAPAEKVGADVEGEPLPLIPPLPSRRPRASRIEQGVDLASAAEPPEPPSRARAAADCAQGATAAHAAPWNCLQRPRWPLPPPSRRSREIAEIGHFLGALFSRRGPAHWRKWFFSPSWCCGGCPGDHQVAG